MSLPPEYDDWPTEELEEELNRLKMRKQVREESRLQDMLDELDGEDNYEFEGHFSRNKVLNGLAGFFYVIGFIMFSPIIVPLKILGFVCRPLFAAYRHLVK